VSAVEASASPKPARAMRWSWRSRCARGSLSATCADSSWRAAKRLGWPAATSVRVRKKVIWKPQSARVAPA